MINSEKQRPRQTFVINQLRPSQLEEVVSWAGGGSARLEGDHHTKAMAQRMYTEFLRHYRPLWHCGEVASYVMTLNRVPIFCVSTLRIGQPEGKPQSACIEGHIYLLIRPEVRRSQRPLLLAWQAATVHTFLKMGFSSVQTAVHEEEQEENDVLSMLGYRLTETTTSTSGKTNLYVCQEQDLQMVM